MHCRYGNPCSSQTELGAEQAFMERQLCWVEGQSREKSGASVELALPQDVVSRNRYYLSAIVDIVKLFAVHELSFRDTEEDLGSLHSGLIL